MNEYLQAIAWFYLFKVPGAAGLFLLGEWAGTGKWRWRVFFRWLMIGYALGAMIIFWRMTL